MTTGDNRAIGLLVELFVHPGRVAEFRRLKAYRADRGLVALAPLRKSAIARTAVRVGIDAQPCGAVSA